MFGKLPELFSRNFAIGYFLPFSALLTASIGIISDYGYLNNLIDLNSANQLEILIGTTILGLLSWFGGIVLLAINRDIIRLYEGYGRYNPIRVIRWFEMKKYKALKKSIKELDAEFLGCIDNKSEFPLHRRQERNKLLQRAAERFPDEEQWILPTPFGNVVRAFEIYPRKMYGIDSVLAWDRLLTIISKDYAILIDNAKALVDFWINLSFISLVVILEYIVFVIYTRHVIASWIPVIFLGLIVVSFFRAQSAAIEWGNFVKSSFDVYLPELGNKLGFNNHGNRDEDRADWVRFSQSIIYADPEMLPDKAEVTQK